MSDSTQSGLALKAALFATGCAGIVAEFVLSTLATYLIGNAIFQWTIVMSLMLFAMGLGSRLSRYVRNCLLDQFILIEFSLSVLCAASAITAYSLSAYTDYIALLIYLLALIIGTLIGLEIPIVTRLNDAYEELRINISGVLEKDYYGSLLGGLAFAFFALPKLGLTYTPIILGSINCLVAGILLWRFARLIKKRRTVWASGMITVLLLALLAVYAQPIIMYGEQKKYRDKVIYSQQTRMQKIVMTQWKKYYWLYINGQEQFSTFDEEKYHEPLVHPAMQLSPDTSHVLVLGGGDGLATREILKYPDVQSVTLVDLDPAMTNLAKTHPVLARINHYAFQNPKVHIHNADASVFLKTNDQLYGVIIADLPDPDTIDLMHVYSRQFYAKIKQHLIRGGVFVTQAASPYFAGKAFLCILKTIQAAGYTTIPYHNQIPTMGEWGWVLAVRKGDIPPEKMADRLVKVARAVDTRYFNKDAMISMTHFGKGVLEAEKLNPLIVNTDMNPVLYRYYMDGTWDMY